MCGLYGFVNYSGEKMKNLADLTNSLSEESAIRGTDATGIAFCKNGNISIVKKFLKINIPLVELLFFIAIGYFYKNTYTILANTSNL